MTRAAVYARVSTADQVEGTSLGVQKNRCEAEIARRGWTHVETFVDGGVSGSKATRPQLDRLLEAVRAGEVDAIVVSKLDRLGRSLAHLAPLFAELDELQVAFVSLSEDIDSSSISGRAMRALLGVFGEMEREVIAERGVSGQRAKALAGQWPGGTPPFGWRLEGTGRAATPVSDEREREVIRTSYEAMVRDGLSTGETTTLLNGLGMHKRTGGPWTHQHLRRQLEKRSLVGETWWGLPTRPHGAGHNTKLGRDGQPKFGAPIRLKLPDPPLTVQEHDALLTALRQRAYGAKSPDQIYPNSGAAAVCGGRLGGVYRRDRGLRQYRCTNSRWTADGAARCDCPRFDADWLDAQVWAAVSDALADPAWLTQLADEYLGMREDGPDAAPAEDLDRKIRELQRARTDRAVAALTAGVPAGVIAAAVEEIDGQLAALTVRQRAVEAWRADTEARESHADALVRLAAQAADRLPGMDLERQREVLQLLGVRVTLLDATARPALRIDGELPGGGLELAPAPEGHGGPDVRDPDGEVPRRPGPHRRRAGQGASGVPGARGRAGPRRRPLRRWPAGPPGGRRAGGPAPARRRPRPAAAARGDLPGRAGRTAGSSCPCRCPRSRRTRCATGPALRPAGHRRPGACRRRPARRARTPGGGRHAGTGTCRPARPGAGRRGAALPRGAGRRPRAARRRVVVRSAQPAAGRAGVRPCRPRTAPRRVPARRRGRPRPRRARSPGRR